MLPQKGRLCMEVVDAIATVETGANDKPVEDIIIESITFEGYTAQ